VLLAELAGNFRKRPAVEGDPVDARQQQRERDRLRVGVGELLIGKSREEQNPPVFGQAGEDRVRFLARVLAG
jgi:hypothetical protein